MMTSLRSLPLLIGITSVSLVAIGEPALANTAVPLTPTSAWTANYDADSCSVLRSFGTGDDKLLLRLTWFQPSNRFQVMLVGKPLRTSESSSKVRIGFGPGDVTRLYDSMNGVVADQPMLILSGVRLDNGDLRVAEERAPRITPVQEHAVDWVEVTLDGYRRWRLQLGSMGGVMATVRACNRDLVQHWGFDADKQASLSRRATPLGSVGSWLTTDDHPPQALNRNANGLVRFRLGVNENGAITDCQVQTSIQPLDFAELSCTLIRKRGRFVPALDAAGKPTASYYVNTVRWNAF